MNPRSYLLCAISCAAWIANTAYAEVECHGNECTITVTVNSCDDIVVNPDGLSTDHPVNLRWEIVTPDYDFLSDTGIQFSDPQFVAKNPAKSNEFHVHDNKSTTGTFPYQVNIAGCAPTDPYVRNK